MTGTAWSKRLVRYLYLLGGLLCLLLAGIGVVIPGIPTTVFLLLAAGAFARSCPVMYRWLLDNRLFGPYLRAWQANPSLPRWLKAYIVTVILFSVTASLLLANPPLLLGVPAVGLALMGCYWVSIRVPTRTADQTSKKPL